MERFTKCGYIVLTMVSISLTVVLNAQPTTISVNGADSSLPKSIIPKENARESVEPPPEIFLGKDAKIVTLPPDELPQTNHTGELAEVAPLIFPNRNSSVPMVEIPPYIFPDNNKTFTVIPPINETALKILNGERVKNPILLPDTYDEDSYFDEVLSEEESDENDQVEEVQPIDKSRQTDELEENYKSKSKLSAFDDFTVIDEVDHPMLRNTHLVGIIAATLAVLCACIYIGLIIWRRIIFNRYGMRERLINEDDFSSSKSINSRFY